LSRYKFVGKNAPRADGLSRVKGYEIYTSDVSIPGMLYGKIIHSEFPRALVKSINTENAEKMGAICLTYKDVPSILFNPRLVSTEDASYKDWKVLTNKPNYLGEPIAVCLAETEDLAQRAASEVKVEYEVYKPYFEAKEALTSNDSIHDTILLGSKKIKVENNVGCTLETTEGDPDKAFKEADIVFKREYKTNRRYHTQMETKGAVVKPEADGSLTVWTTTQSIHNTRILISRVFNIPQNKINVKKVALGGSFGSSIQTNLPTLIAVAAALKTKRPIKIILTREEDLYDHADYQMIIELKAGISKEGIIIAGEMNMIMDIGAHQVQAYPLLGTAFGWWASSYKWKNFRYKGIAVYTNKVPSNAFRGYGNPQVTWAVESFIDEITETYGFDPLEFKLKNEICTGDIFWGQGPTVKTVVQSCGLPELIKKGAEMIHWEKGRKFVEDNKVIGLGMAKGFHTSSAGSPISGTIVDFSGATVKVNEDGSVDVITALIDMGEGTYEAMKKLAAEVLQVPLDKITVVNADTSTTVYDVNTHASRGVFAGGGAVFRAALSVRDQILEHASIILGINKDSLKIVYNEENGETEIFNDAFPEKKLTLRDLAFYMREKNIGTLAATVSYRPFAGPPHFTVYFVKVEIDTETGELRPLEVVAGADVGTVINPDLAEAQIHGGFVMGWSMVTLEDTPYNNKTGEIMTEYMKIPRSTEIPDLDNFKVFFANTYEPNGPLGAKGLGEGSLNPVAGAIANAISAALGIRFYELPITPEKILKALEEKKKELVLLK